MSLPAPANDATGVVAVIRGYWKPTVAVIVWALLICLGLALAERAGVNVALVAAKWGLPVGAAVVSTLLVYLHAMSTGRVLRWIVLPAAVAFFVAAAGLHVYVLGVIDGERGSHKRIATLEGELEAARKPPEKPLQAAALPPLPMPPPVAETPPAPWAVAPRPARRPRAAKPLPAKAAEPPATLSNMKWPF